MAKIYDAQIQWQAPSGHRFQAQPLEDYISAGLANVSRAAGEASEGIQKLHDQDAAALMSKAGQESKKFIEDFEDFFGDYMGKMEAGAMKFWDDAYAQLDEPTRRRFDMNNPKAREIFELTAKQAAVDKSLDHQYTEYSRRVPVYASQIIALGDPAKIKEALAAKVYELSENSGMRMADAEKVVDQLQRYVADGAVNMLIGEDRLDEAAELNNDLAFTAMLAPDQRIQNNNTIRSIRQKQQDELLKQQSSGSKNAAKENRDFVYNGLKEEMSYVHDKAVSNGKGAEWSDLLYRVASDFQEGKLADSYEAPDGSVVLLRDLVPEYALYTDMNYADRIAVAQDLIKAFEGSPEVYQRIGKMKVDAATLLDSLPKDDDGRISIKSIPATKVARIKDVLDQVDENYATLDKDLRDYVETLRAVSAAYREMERAALAPSNFIMPGDVIEKGTFMGSTEDYASLEGNFSYGSLQNARGDKEGVFSASYLSSQGTEKNEKLRDALLRRVEISRASTGNNRMPAAGSTEEMIEFNKAYLNDAPLEMKQKLGIADASTYQILDAKDKEISLYDRMGMLNNTVDEGNKLVRPTLPDWYEATSWDKLSPAARKALLPSDLNVEQMAKLGGGSNSPVVLYNAIINNDESLLDAITDGSARKALKKAYKKFQETTVKDINTSLKENAKYKGMTNAADVAEKALKYKYSNAEKPTYSAPDMSVPIEETDYYLSLVRMIRAINPGSQPDAKTVRDIASQIRSASYSNWWKSMGDAVPWLFRRASMPVEGSHAREVLDESSNLTVKSRGI